MSQHNQMIAVIEIPETVEKKKKSDSVPKLTGHLPSFETEIQVLGLNFQMEA